jgi:ABC-type uncharacterized transport system substrate-binding protein
MQGEAMRRNLLVAAIATGLAGPALAHPHIFIDTALEVVFDDQNRATGVRVTWIYDDFFSLTVIGDKGLDPDFDGVLTPDELAQLSGFDMAWDADYPGDTYALLGGQALSLSRPTDWTAQYDGGKITTTHLRHFEAPVSVGQSSLLVQVYDPSFYTSYSIVGTPVLTGAVGCTVQVFEPDRAAADAILQAALDKLSGTDGIETDFPAVGAAYSEEARISCAAP